MDEIHVEFVWRTCYSLFCRNTVTFTLLNNLSPMFHPSVRIEETWRLWQKFLDDFARFGEWLATSEKTAALPNSSGVLYTVAKEELKKFEVQTSEKNLLLFKISSETQSD